MSAATADRPTVSVVIAAHRAEATIGRAVASLLAQTRGDFEAILVSDDGVDYLALLAGLGLADRRLAQVSTGAVGAGCTRARNVGFARVRGAFVTRLDADDLYDPRRLERLVPLAEARGVALDGVDVRDDATGTRLRRVPAEDSARTATAHDLALTHCPFVPLVARALAPPWFEDVDISEDVLYLFALEERIGALPLEAEPLYHYRIRAGSMCHGADAAERADRSYAALDAQLASGAFPALSPPTVARARDAFARKRAFNLAFARAQAAGDVRDFQEFCVRTAADGTTDTR